MHYDLLVHVDLADAKRMSMALTNIKNYNNALESEHKLGKDYHVVVLANAGAVSFLLEKSEEHFTVIKELAQAGVEFRACNNALNKHGIKPEDLPAHVQVVKAGIVEIVDLQRAGYAYLKP